MSLRIERDAYRRESPGPIDYGYFLNVSWFDTAKEIEELISRWQAKAAACASGMARTEWLVRIAKLRDFLTEDN
ncbi:hypothetical protein [Streptomyces sp. NPDC047928]|uniref:hypothetical protein n=1 Tax=unclassified Streptomyces TaxID=2593676 RepID=UPI00371994DE